MATKTNPDTLYSFNLEYGEQWIRIHIQFMGDSCNGIFTTNAFGNVEEAAIMAEALYAAAFALDPKADELPTPRQWRIRGVGTYWLERDPLHETAKPYCPRRFDLWLSDAAEAYHLAEKMLQMTLMLQRDSIRKAYFREQVLNKEVA